MKAILMYLFILVILFVICLIVGFVGCLYNGTMGFRNGSLVALDPNGQVVESLPWSEGWCNSTSKPTEEEVKQIKAEHQEYRSSKAYNLCFLALAVFAIGWLTGNPQARTVGTVLLIGAGVWDYKALGVALYLYYFIIPAIVIMAIVGLFKRN